MSYKKGSCKTDYDIGRIQIDQVRSLFKKNIVESDNFKIFVKVLNQNNLYYDAEKYILTSILKHFKNDFDKQIEIINCLHLDDLRIQLDIFGFDQKLFAKINQNYEVQVQISRSEWQVNSETYNCFNPVSPELVSFLIQDRKNDSEVINSKVFMFLNEDQLCYFFTNASFYAFQGVEDKIESIFYLHPKVYNHFKTFYKSNKNNVNAFGIYNLLNYFAQKQIYPSWFQELILILAENYKDSHQSDDNEILKKLLAAYKPYQQMKSFYLCDTLLNFILINYPKMLPKVLEWRELDLDQKILVMEKEKEIYEPLMGKQNFITLNNHAYFSNYGSTFEEVLTNLRKSKIILTEL